VREEMSDFDLVVVGTGASGTAAALACAKAGWRVAIVDELPFGGTCALRGCDPKKVLIGAAELIDWSQRMRGSGVVGTIAIEWTDLMRFKRSFTEPFPEQREAALREAGIATYHGAARFTDATTIAVSQERLRARRVVLATGAHPAPLQLPGEEHLITSTDFLDLDRLPKRLAFIGGGYIAFEFAHLAARAGAAPVILQRGARVLTGFEPSLVDRIVDVSASVGVDVRVNVEVMAIEKEGELLRVRGARDGIPFALDCDLAVHAAGRVADLDALALDVAGVERTKKGVAVNEFLQSRSNPSVYAVGDCADGGGLPLTPTASAEGELAARNLLDGNRHTIDFSGLASIVYTIPSLGMTGCTQERAKAMGLRYTLFEGDTTQWYSSRRVRARQSFYRLLVAQSGDAILGAHVLGPHTEELVNIFALAIRERISPIALKGVLFAYPTASSDIATMLEKE
jgi:glutathione reductase (NADPH)